MQYSDNELAALISQVETDFSQYLKKAETTNKEQLEKTEATEEVAKTEVVSFEYSDDDIAEMNEMYSSMTKSEQEAHYQSIKTAIFGEEGEPVQKTEETVVEVAKSEDVEKIADLEGKLKKSEEDYEELKKSFSDLVEKLSNNVKKSSAPKQKAVTKIEYIAKSEENVSAEENKEDITKLDKSEISKRLTSKARTSSLTKSDRDAINDYYLNDKQDIESIRHLL